MRKFECPRQIERTMNKKKKFKILCNIKFLFDLALLKVIKINNVLQNCNCVRYRLFRQINWNDQRITDNRVMCWLISQNIKGIDLYITKNKNSSTFKILEIFLYSFCILKLNTFDMVISTIFLPPQRMRAMNIVKTAERNITTRKYVTSLACSTMTWSDPPRRSSQ